MRVRKGQVSELAAVSEEVVRVYGKRGYATSLVYDG